MLRQNLSTRPFYNDRAVRTALAVLGAIALGLTAFNVIEVFRLERAGREARQTVAQNNAQARDMRDQARVIRQSINQAQLDAVQASAREANGLIDRRSFSWTELLNFFQATLPPDVRVTRVAPQVDSEGRMLVAITAISRRVDDVNEFMDALEKTGAFVDVLSRQDTVEEDGTWRSELQAYYAVPPAESTAAPRPASEPDTGATNATPAVNVTPGVPR